MRFSTSTAFSLAVMVALLAGAAGCKRSSSSNPAPLPGTPAAPTVVSLDVTSGSTVGGTAVSITGTGFLTGATVLFGANLATGVTVFPGTGITCSTPAGTVGAVAVTVTNTDTQNGQLAGAFTYTSGGGGGTPTVTAISPSSGTSNGGTPVTITGTNFAVGATVTIGGNALTNTTVVNSTTIAGTTPAGTGTSLNVTVTNPSSANGQAALWSYTATGTAPTVSSLSASSGLAAGGDVVTVNGSNFSIPSVTIDGTDQPVSTSGATSATVTTAGAGPCGSGGARGVTVTNGNGESATLASAWTYTHNIPETLNNAVLATDIAVDGAGVIHVVFSIDTGSSNSDIMHVRSTDNGRTWTSPANRISNSTNPSVMPKIAANGNNVVLVWDEQNSTTHRVEYTRSTDNGQNWASNASMPVGSPNGLAFVAAPDVAIDGSNTVTVTWIAIGPTPSPPSLAGPDSQVFVASGTLSGVSSASTTKLSGTGTLIGNLAVVADGSGNALVVWGEGFNGSVVQMPNDIHLSRTSNSGANWSAVIVVKNTGNSLQGGPSIAMRGSDAVIVYADLAAGPNYSVQSYTSGDTGATWSAGATIRTASSTVVQTPVVAADAAGWFMATYTEIGASFTNRQCTRSSDAATTWSTPLIYNPTSNASTAGAIAGGAAGVFKHVWLEFDSTFSVNGVRQW